MYDFNDVHMAPPRYDLRAIEDRLRSTAPFWLPRYFPGGRQASDRSEIRCADISGRSPRKEGSCVVRLTGPHAGTAYDWDGGQSFSAIDIIGVHENLAGAALFERAAAIAGVSASSAPQPRLPAIPAPAPKDDSKTKAEIEFVLSSCVPASGTLAETYLASRSLKLPPSPDLLFHPDLADRGGTNRGWPAMIGVVRLADGTATGGIHRTFLADDGSGKAPIEKAKRMWGPVSKTGGGVWLGDATSSGIAVGEGIETTVAGMMIFGVSRGCAALSAGAMELWEWPVGTTAVLILADAGKAGADAAHKLAARVQAAGIAYRIVFPIGDDDFNADLIAGHVADHYDQATKAEAAPIERAPETYDELHAAAMNLGRESDHMTIGSLLAALVMAGLEPIPENHIVQKIKERTGQSTKVLDLQIREIKKRVRPAARARGDALWTNLLRLDEFGNTERNVSNISIAIDNAPELAGLWAFDEFAQLLILCRPAPWASEARGHIKWTDVDDIRFSIWLQQKGLNVSDALANKAVQEAARRNSFDPVTEYFGGLKWDGVERLSTWLVQYVGSKDTPFVRHVGAAWMISAVARTYQPGAKVDTMLILEGEQGLKKSTVFKTLAGEAWFTDKVGDLSNKDTLMNLQGCLIVEMAELDQFSKTDVKHLKGFMSSQVDRFRPPYGRTIVDHPRRFIFGGTTNEDTYLRDETGGRRFWPIKCGTLNINGLALARDQLWAEAVARYRDGAIWWIEDQDVLRLAKAEQEERFQEDAWTSQIDRWLTHEKRVEDYGNGLRIEWVKRKEPVSDVSVGEVLEGAFGIDAAKWSRSDQMRVSAILKSKKWERYQRKIGGDRDWRYRRPVWLVDVI